jgi:hypothetical protein
MAQSLSDKLITAYYPWSHWFNVTEISPQKTFSRLGVKDSDSNHKIHMVPTNATSLEVHVYALCHRVQKNKDDAPGCQSKQITLQVNAGHS